MKIDVKARKISFKKDLNKLDELALLFSERLSAAKIHHVFLSGYVAILFGRNRQSEDIDVVCERVPFRTFAGFWADINKEFECIITSNARTAYNEYLNEGMAIRFARRGEFIPNVEMKIGTTTMHREALSYSLTVAINKRTLPISPLEQQIAYKLYMGSEKDVEDARFLFKLFEENIDKDKLGRYLTALKVQRRKARRHLGWSK